MKASVSKIILRTLTCVIAALGSDQGLRAQSVYGSVLGTITDATGAVIAGTGVTLANAGTNEERRTQSDTNGNYQFVNLRSARLQAFQAILHYSGGAVGSSHRRLLAGRGEQPEH
jgi:hypothetical protein